MDIKKAIGYIKTNGNIVEKARFEWILWDKKTSKDILQELTSFQKFDGGFSYWVKEVSNIWILAIF